MFCLASVPIEILLVSHQETIQLLLYLFFKRSFKQPELINSKQHVNKCNDLKYFIK